MIRSFFFYPQVSRLGCGVSLPGEARLVGLGATIQSPGLENLGKWKGFWKAFYVFFVHHFYHINHESMIDHKGNR